MKVYLVVESRWLDYYEYSGAHEEIYIHSVYSTIDKAEQKVQMLANNAIANLREPTDPDEPVDQPKIEIRRDEAGYDIFEIEVTSTDEHESRTFYIKEMEVE